MRPSSFWTGSVAAMILILPCDAQNLVFWNTLDGDSAVLQSAVGPPLSYYTGGSPIVTVPGTRAYAPGVSGQAFTLGPGPYVAGLQGRAIQLLNPGSVLNPERGTIEGWYLNRVDPVPYVNNAHCLFGSNSCPYDAGIALWVQALDSPVDPPRVRFFIQACGAPVFAYSLLDGMQGVRIDGFDNRWLHFAAVWDRLGIAGSSHTLRLYVNGQLLGANTAGGWGTSFGWAAAVGTGNDPEVAGKFLIDEIKVWDAAKTAFDIPFGLYAAQLDGPGSGMLVNYAGPPGATWFTTLTVDPANAGSGFGTGWWGGLHISWNDVLTQWLTQAPPLVGILDARGDSSFVWPAGALSPSSGWTVWLVTHAFTPAGAFAGVTAPVRITLD